MSQHHNTGREAAPMRITLRVLGLTLLDVEVTEHTADEDEWADSGTTSSTAIGFAPSPGDQRWEQSADYGYGDDE